ncbi:MAG: DUF2974 domain-containing protein [Clostridia bacterium]|nr:DUF2974 domain-containing protein [Clostridia bacterium]MBP5271390.1 DUF2974 domain-containing protein [Clostridia bacterium]
MQTILDYLAWRGDLPISEDAPLNELDFVVLSRFSNLPFYDVYHTEEETMGSFCSVMTRFPREPFQIAGDVPFVKLIADSKRFSTLRVTDYVKDNRKELEMQFAAVTIHLPGDVLFLSFCGTDSTLLGWKENLNMSFQDDVPAQCAALSYAANALKSYPDLKGLYMGGHSKGGNLAAYAAVCLPSEYRKLVLGVFSYDGPGFSNKFIASHAIDEMADRMFTFLPEGSTVGRMLEHAESFEVVKSTVDNLLQHDLYTWAVEPLKLVRAEKSSDGSELFYNGVRHLLEETTPKQRELVLAGVYSIVTANAVKPKDIQDDFTILLQPLYRQMRSMNREDWAVVTKVFRAFLDAYVLAIRDVGQSKYAKEINELRNAENFQEAAYTLLNRALARWNGGRTS